MPWVIATNGRVCSAHCDCKAGLGEVCTHVATLLFGIDAGVRIREKTTVTQVKAYWMEPTRKNVNSAPISNVDFSSAAKRKRRLDATIDGTEEEMTQQVHGEYSSSASCPASELKNEPALCELLHGLSLTSTKCAILSAVDPYAEQFIPPETVKEFPPILTDLADKNTFDFSYADLLKRCETVEYQVTSEAARNCEAYTRQQAKSGIWFRYRAGRVTASKLKSACRTDAGAPSVSLIKSVCYPDLHRFSTEATRWGCEHELIAREKYEMIQNAFHKGFVVKDSGLIISPKFPHLGATPDGLVACGINCCGDTRLGVCEIKCPFGKKDMSIAEAAADKGFCLESVDGHLQLRTDHMYYYQVQAQIFLSERAYCDFVVWTENDIHIERITGDVDFWNDAVMSATHFFKVGVLPELVGKHFTSQPKNMETYIMATDDDNVAKSCYCQQGDSGKMILCDNTKCVLGWFHFECLALPDDYETPKTWFCPDCRLLPKSQRKVAKPTKTRNK